MFLSASFLALAAYAAAFPVPGGGFAVPLSKRATGLKRLNGVSVAAVQKRQAVSLSEINSGVKWAGPIIIGGQPFTVDFDTGSSDLWIPSKDCKSSVCEGRNKYDFETGTRQSGEFRIKYFDGGSVAGHVYADTVSVGGVEVHNQVFSPIHKASGNVFNGESSTDGILGLAFPSNSLLKRPPFFNNAVKQGAVKKAEFSLYLASKGAEIYLGGSNPNLYSGEPEPHHVKADVGKWFIDGASVSINGAEIAHEFSATIDSGTSVIVGPPDDVDKLYAAIPNSSAFATEAGYYHIPCDTNAEVSFNFGKKDWRVSGKDLILRSVAKEANSCVGSIIGQHDPLGKSAWTLGDPFMKNVYTTFSFADNTNTVSFAELKGSSWCSVCDWVSSTISSVMGKNGSN